MINNYVLSESDSENVFGVISAENKAVLIELTALAIKEEFTYKTVSFRSDSYSERSGTIFMSFNCVSEDDEDSEDIREVELNLTAVYNFDDVPITDKDILKNNRKFRNEMLLLAVCGWIGSAFYWCFHFLPTITNKGVWGIIGGMLLVITYFYLRAELEINKLKSKDNGKT